MNVDGRGTVRKEGEGEKRKEKRKEMAGDKIGFALIVLEYHIIFIGGRRWF